jgi:hypothetical protein
MKMVAKAKSSRWRKFMKDEGGTEPKPSKQQLDSDVSDFLKPSTDKAAASRPRIDIGLAKRWPGAREVLSSAAGSKSPGPGGLKTGTRQKGLSVSFVRTLPEIIGHGGDETEEETIQVSRRKAARNAQTAGATPPQRPQDDAHINTNIGRTPSTAEQRTSLTRTLTHGEMSPPLSTKLEMGHINGVSQPAPPPQQRMGQMGLGERPRGLMRGKTVHVRTDCETTLTSYFYLYSSYWLRRDTADRSQCATAFARLRSFPRLRQSLACLATQSLQRGAHNSRGGGLPPKNDKSGMSSCAMPDQ